jgi:hypothetical protein
MISHTDYTALISAKINRTITPAEERKLDDFESAAPEKCPHCGIKVWSPFKPARVVHDLANCPKKA